MRLRSCVAGYLVLRLGAYSLDLGRAYLLQVPVIYNRFNVGLFGCGRLLDRAFGGIQVLAWHDVHQRLVGLGGLHHSGGQGRCRHYV